MVSKKLDCMLDNVLAARLGRIATDAGEPFREGVGDSIDRGLILLRLLHEEGFDLHYRRDWPKTKQ